MAVSCPDPAIPNSNPTMTQNTPMATHVAVNGLTAIQSLHTIQPISTPSSVVRPAPTLLTVPTCAGTSVVTMTLLDPLRTNADPLCTLVVPFGIASLPATIVVAVQGTATIQLPVPVQCPKTLEPVTEPVVSAPTPVVLFPPPLMTTPAPLLPTIEPMADPDPPVANCVPTVGDILPVAVMVAEKTPVTIQSFESPQPMTTPLPAGMTPLIFASPAPLLAAMVPVTDALPHVADCDPLSTLVTPVAVVVAVLTSVTVQSLQAIQPVTTPCATTPAPVVMSPNPFVLTIQAVTLPNPLIADRVPISTLTTPVTVVIFV